MAATNKIKRKIAKEIIEICRFQGIPHPIDAMTTFYARLNFYYEKKKFQYLQSRQDVRVVSPGGYYR